MTSLTMLEPLLAPMAAVQRLIEQLDNQDMGDIEAVVAVQEHLDTQRIAFWVRQFAELLETPELWTDLEKLLRRART